MKRNIHAICNRRQLVVVRPDALRPGRRVRSPAGEAEHGAAVVPGGEGEQVVLVQAKEGAQHKLRGERGRLGGRGRAARGQHQSQAQHGQQGLRGTKY